MLATNTETARRKQRRLLVSSVTTLTSAPRLNKWVLPPEVPEPTVGPDLLQPLQIFSQLVVQTVGENLKQERFESSESVSGTSTQDTLKREEEKVRTEDRTECFLSALPMI